jgi:DUF2993 family protein
VRRILGLIVLLAVLAGVDLLARSIAEQQVVDQVKSELPANAHVSASIPAFPFVPRIVFWGSVPKVKVKATDLAGKPLSVADVNVSVTGVEISRHSLLHHRRVDLVAIDRGTVSAEVTQGAIADVLHIPVTIGSGRVTIRVNGQDLTATPTINKNNQLVLTPVGAGPVQTVGLGQAELIPCAAKVEVEEAKVRVSCTFNHIPDAFVRAANKAK